MEVTGLSRAAARSNSNSSDANEQALAKSNKDKPDRAALVKSSENAVQQKVRRPEIQSSEEQTKVENKASIVAASIISPGQGVAVVATKSDAEGIEKAEEKTAEIERVLPDNVGKNLDTSA